MYRSSLQCPMHCTNIVNGSECTAEYTATASVVCLRCYYALGLYESVEEAQDYRHNLTNLNNKFQQRMIKLTFYNGRATSVSYDRLYG